MTNMEKIFKIIGEASEVTGVLVTTTKNKQRDIALEEQAERAENFKNQQTEKNIKKAVEGNTNDKPTGICR